MLENNIWKEKKSSDIPSTLKVDDDFYDFIPINAKILDLGCGNGKLCIELSKKGYECYGIDLSIDAIEEGKSNITNIKNCFFCQMDASNLEFKNEFFDAIIIKAVLTVVSDVEIRKKIMEEAFRVLKKGGYVYLTEFAQTWQNEYYRNRYIDNYPITNEEGLFKVLGENGEELYTAKHFSNKEIADLYFNVGFKTYTFITSKVKTRSGNIIDGYKIVLNK